MPLKVPLFFTCHPQKITSPLEKCIVSYKYNVFFIILLFFIAYIDVVIKLCFDRLVRIGFIMLVGPVARRPILMI